VVNSRKRDVEIHLNDRGRYLILGIPTKELFDKFYYNPRVHHP
jgi:hypothetical protein